MESETTHDEGPSQALLTCRHCGEDAPYDQVICGECGSPLVVGYLESQGTGVIPRDHVFGLCRRPYRIGRQLTNDHIVPCHSANSVLIEYRDIDEFSLHPPDGTGICLLNDRPLDHRRPICAGDSIRLGSDHFIFYEGIPPGGMGTFVAQQAQEANLVLIGAFMEIAGAAALNDACAVAVDAVLRLTRMDRGIFFLTDTDDSGELVLRQCVTRELTAHQGFTDVDAPFRISQSLLQQSLTGGGTIVIDDARKRNNLPHSMVELNLNSLACIPIVCGDRREYLIEDCIGIVYADSFMPTTDVEAHVSPLLTMLASYLSTIIMNWRQ